MTYCHEEICILFHHHIINIMIQHKELFCVSTTNINLLLFVAIYLWFHMSGSLVYALTFEYTIFCRYKIFGSHAFTTTLSLSPFQSICSVCLTCHQLQIVWNSQFVDLINPIIWISVVHDEKKAMPQQTRFWKVAVPNCTSTCKVIEKFCSDSCQQHRIWVSVAKHLAEWFFTVALVITSFEMSNIKDSTYSYLW